MFTFSDVIHYVPFDTFVGDCFLNPSSVLARTLESPSGAPAPHSSPAWSSSSVKSQQHWAAYRPRGTGCATGTAFSSLIPCHGSQKPLRRICKKIRTHLKELTGMDIAIEQDSKCLRFLECMLNYPTGPHLLSLPDFLECTSDSTPPQVEKLMDPTAPRCGAMLRSLVPSRVKKAAHYRLSRARLRIICVSCSTCSLQRDTLSICGSRYSGRVHERGAWSCHSSLHATNLGAVD